MFMVKTDILDVQQVANHLSSEDVAHGPHYKGPGDPPRTQTGNLLIKRYLKPSAVLTS